MTEQLRALSFFAALMKRVKFIVMILSLPVGELIQQI